jgi:hypothetical protein
MLPEPISALDRLLEGKFGLHAQSDVLQLFKTVPEATAHLRAAENILRMRGDRAWLVLPFSMRLR